MGYIISAIFMILFVVFEAIGAAFADLFLIFGSVILGLTAFLPKH